MSHQMHVIYSDFFHGAGIMAGGPFACEIRNLNFASSMGSTQYDCFGNGDSADKIDVDTLISNARKMADVGLIANLDNLKNTKIWVESTTTDQTVNYRIVDKVVDFYRSLGNTKNLTYRTDTVSPHAFQTTRDTA